MRRPLVLAALAAALLAPAAQAKPLVVVQANVGNIDPACADARYKLCLPDVEARAAKALRKLHPDVVGLEEVLPGTHQPRKLLGTGYAVSCDRRFGWDCLAVRKASGVTVVKPLRTRPVVSACDDTGFTLNSGLLRRGKATIAVGVVHPDSTDAACRAAQLEDFFGALPETGEALVLGDFNLDPFREDDASVDAFDAARKALRLKLLDGKAYSLTTQFPPPFGTRTIDHVLGRGVRGSCRIREVDGGSGMDHRAQVCTVRTA